MSMVIIICFESLIIPVSVSSHSWHLSMVFPLKFYQIFLVLCMPSIGAQTALMPHLVHAFAVTSLGAICFRPHGGWCMLCPECCKACSDFPWSGTQKAPRYITSRDNWHTDGVTLCNCPVTSPPCPSLYKSWGLRAALGREQGWRLPVFWLDGLPNSPCQ